MDMNNEIKQIMTDQQDTINDDELNELKSQV